MFDTVGKARKVNRRRQAGSLILSLLMLASAGSSILVAGTQLVEEVHEDEPVEVTFLDEAPPPPPPPPPPPAAEEEEEVEEEEEEEEDEVEPEEPEDVIELPKEIPEEKPKKSTKGGQVGGVEGGVEGGVVGGVMGGVLGGVLGGQLGGTGVKTVHWSEVKAKKQVKAVMPEAARTMNIEGQCRLRFFIDEQGIPYEIKVESCPNVFKEEALKAAHQWQFYPMKENGAPIRSQFVLTFTFQLH